MGIVSDKGIWCNSFSKRMNGSLVLQLLHFEVSNVCNSNLKSSRGGGLSLVDISDRDIKMEKYVL